MSPEQPTLLSKEAKEKIIKIVRRAHYETGLVMVQNFFLSLFGFMIVCGVSIWAGVVQTAFPTLAMIGTLLTVNLKYGRPKVIEIGAKYDAQIKEVVEEEKRKANPSQG